jgi:hypothetical protein
MAEVIPVFLLCIYKLIKPWKLTRDLFYSHAYPIYVLMDWKLIVMFENHMSNFILLEQHCYGQPNGSSSNDCKLCFDERFYKDMIQTRVKSNNEREHSLSSSRIIGELFFILFMLLQGPFQHLVN